MEITPIIDATLYRLGLQGTKIELYTYNESDDRMTIPEQHTYDTVLQHVSKINLLISWLAKNKLKHLMFYFMSKSTGHELSEPIIHTVGSFALDGSYKQNSPMNSPPVGEACTYILRPHMDPEGLYQMYLSNPLFGAYVTGLRGVTDSERVFYRFKTPKTNQALQSAPAAKFITVPVTLQNVSQVIQPGIVIFSWDVTVKEDWTFARSAFDFYAKNNWEILLVKESYNDLSVPDMVKQYLPIIISRRPGYATTKSHFYEVCMDEISRSVGSPIVIYAADQTELVAICSSAVSERSDAIIIDVKRKRIAGVVPTGLTFIPTLNVPAFV